MSCRCVGAVGVALAAARARRAVERFSAVKIPGLRMTELPVGSVCVVTASVRTRTD